MVALAEAGHRVLVPDMRGYGESEAPAAPEAYTPFHTVGDLVGVLDHFGLPSAAIAGHDFSASIAWNAALMRPDRFHAVFGMSVPFLRPVTPSFLDGIRAAGRDSFYMFRQIRPEADQEWAEADAPVSRPIYGTSGLAPEGERWDPFDPARGLLRPAPSDMPGIDPAYVREATDSFARTGFRALLNYYRAIDPFFRAVSGTFAGAVIRQPSSFLTGALDGLNTVRPTTEDELRADLPGLHRFTTVPGVGHWPQLEAPVAVSTALVEFLATEVSARPVGKHVQG